jgi:hypothetical protein
MNRLWARSATLACAAVMWATADARAQETFQQVKALYASAAYEDALSMIGRLQAANHRPEYEQYRVFCLVALGRTVEAEQAIAAVVAEDPTFVPDPAEASPRIRDLFVRTRRALVPDIAQRLYQDARASFDRKDIAAASGQFASVVQLIDSTAIAPDDEPMLSELRLLAAGFLDLTRAAARADAPAAVEPAAPKPKAPVQVTAPVPLKQALPAWTPPDPASRREFRGAVRVFISESGAVTGAELTPGVHPLYDRVLLQTARSWQYQPALRNGVPVPSEKIIEVVLKPR